MDFKVWAVNGSAYCMQKPDQNDFDYVPTGKIKLILVTFVFKTHRDGEFYYSSNKSLLEIFQWEQMTAI